MNPPPARDDLQLRRLQTGILLDLARLLAEEHQRLKSLFSDADLKITPGQSRAMMILFQARRPLTARELSREMGVSEVTVSRFVKGLCEGGWVERERDPDDRRAWRLAPTPKARAALPQFVGVSNTLLDEAFAGFSEDEISALAGVVERIRGNLG